MLTTRVNPKTGKEQYCLISTSNDRVLEWYGEKKPSLATVAKTEARVEMFKHMKKG
jgi:hypothetical protein